MLLFILIAGLYYPCQASIAGGVFLVARILYCWYASNKGAFHPLRRTGAILGDLAMLTALVYGVLSALKLVNGN